MPHRDKEKAQEYYKKYYQVHKKKYFERSAKRQEQNRQWFEKTFADILHCSRCPETDRCCLDFHHTDPTKKENKLADMIRCHSKEKIEAEVKKCIVLCSNCHRKLHAGKISPMGD